MLKKKMAEYSEKFDDGFPMIPLGWGKSEDEVIKIIDECLRENKDVYEMGFLADPLDDDIEY